jgi:hypothetical protein
VQLPGFVRETLQQRGGLIERLAASRHSAAVGRLRLRLDVKGPGKMLAVSDVARALSLVLAVMSQCRLKRFQRLGLAALLLLAR